MNRQQMKKMPVPKIRHKILGGAPLPEYADGIYGHPMNEGYTVWDMLKFLEKMEPRQI